MISVRHQGVAGRAPRSFNGLGGGRDCGGCHRRGGSHGRSSDHRLGCHSGFGGDVGGSLGGSLRGRVSSALRLHRRAGRCGDGGVDHGLSRHGGFSHQVGSNSGATGPGSPVAGDISRLGRRRAGGDDHRLRGSSYLGGKIVGSVGRDVPGGLRDALGTARGLGGGRIGRGHGNRGGRRRLGRDVSRRSRGDRLSGRQGRVVSGSRTHRGSSFGTHCAAGSISNQPPSLPVADSPTMKILPHKQSTSEPPLPVCCDRTSSTSKTLGVNNLADCHQAGTQCRTNRAASAEKGPQRVACAEVYECHQRV